MPRLLAEFIHISDLHYGPAPEPPLRKYLFARTLGRLIGVFRPAHKLFGHDRAALVSLERFVRKRRLEGERARYPVQLIVTGDLSSFGAPAQFQAVARFLANRVPPSGNPIGLNQPNWRSFTIPGNHDHWPGKPFMLGETSPVFQQTFDSLPIANPGQDPVFPLGGDLPVIRFLRIDTDAGVKPDSMHRLLALGSFERHLQQLSRRLDTLPAGREIRVLLLHHSVTKRDHLYIVEESRLALNDFLIRHDVALLLCGHTHKAGLTFHPPSQKRQFLEARCGTTAQIGKEDYAPISPHIGDLPVDSRIWRRSLLVHRLFGDEAQIDWTVSTYVQRQEEPGGFEPAGRLPTNQPVERTIRVWPR